jgi:hypothetical protein
MEFESWLSESDVERLYKVCHGELPQELASEKEIDEFTRVVMHAVMLKYGGEDYFGKILH